MACKLAALAHFGQVAQQPEAGDVRHGPDAGNLAQLGPYFIELPHLGGGHVGIFGAQDAALLGRGEDAHALAAW